MHNLSDIYYNENASFSSCCWRVALLENSDASVNSQVRQCGNKEICRIRRIITCVPNQEVWGSRKWSQDRNGFTKPYVIEPALDFKEHKELWWCEKTSLHKTSMHLRLPCRIECIACNLALLCWVDAFLKCKSSMTSASMFLFDRFSSQLCISTLS